MGGYAPEDTDLLRRTEGLILSTPALCFLAAQDRLASRRSRGASLGASGSPA